MRMPGTGSTSARTTWGRGRTAPAQGVKAAASRGSSLVMAVLATACAVGLVYLARKELPALKREYRLLRM
jgi:hypothetical protein